MVYWLNRYRRKSRCLSWRWDRWRPMRCTWPYWHARNSKWHRAERADGRTWRVSNRWRPS